MRKYSLTTLILLLVVTAGYLALPGSAAAQQPVVNAVLIFSPTCGHCHYVMEEVVPPLKDLYGDQLSIYYVNASMTLGMEVYSGYLKTYNVPSERQGVPVLLIGDTYLIGSMEIPEQFPGLIESGIAAGGIAYPEVPGLEAYMANPPDASPLAVTPDAPTEAAHAPEEAGEVASSVDEVQPTQDTPLWLLKFRQDLLANIIAVIVLLGMAVSMVINVAIFIRPMENLPSISAPRVSWAIPILCAAGLLVAGYMTYIEVNEVEAVCGPVGDCNSVQQSRYATVLGFMPVAVLGLFGYVGILAAWVIYSFGPQYLRKFASLAMWAMAVFGVLFSIYLTFLEPFVIGATCAWCITSAIIITLLLWITTRKAAVEMAVEG